MAVHPLRPATDRRLGRPLPYQLANRTQATLKAPGPKVPSFAPQSICGISLSFPKLSPSSRHIPAHYSPVRHSPPIEYKYSIVLPFDLHVLGMPPAFNLSQDQTLQFNLYASLTDYLLIYFLCTRILQSAHTVCLLFFLMNLPRRRAAYSTHLAHHVKHFLRFFNYIYCASLATDKQESILGILRS